MQDRWHPRGGLGVYDISRVHLRDLRRIWLQADARVVRFDRGAMFGQPCGCSTRKPSSCMPSAVLFVLGRVDFPPLAWSSQDRRHRPDSKTASFRTGSSPLSMMTLLSLGISTTSSRRGSTGVSPVGRGLSPPAGPEDHRGDAAWPPQANLCPSSLFLPKCHEHRLRRATSKDRTRRATLRRSAAGLRKAQRCSRSSWVTAFSCPACSP
jgi:hypothetical protein